MLDLAPTRNQCSSLVSLPNSPDERMLVLFKAWVNRLVERPVLGSGVAPASVALGAPSLSKANLGLWAAQFRAL
jgi:hypothetical protein